jgi:anti-anti-sigma regulatory factor/dsDNA-binding SOS-regulon protein
MTTKSIHEIEIERLQKELATCHEMLTIAQAAEADRHDFMMDLAMGLSECFEVLSAVQKGNLDTQVSELTLSSSDELVAKLGQTLNETIRNLKDQVDVIQRQAFAIQELSTPILQLWTDILALPVIGVVDSHRAAEIMDRLLSEIVARKSKYVILDITGVEVVDTKTADHFMKLIQAARLVGTQCVVTGIRPAVAQTLVELGVDLNTILTLRDLQAGLHHCLQDMARRRNAEIVTR